MRWRLVAFLMAASCATGAAAALDLSEVPLAGTSLPPLALAVPVDAPALATAASDATAQARAPVALLPDDLLVLEVVPLSPDVREEDVLLLRGLAAQPPPAAHAARAPAAAKAARLDAAHAHAPLAAAPAAPGPAADGGAPEGELATGASRAFAPHAQTGPAAGVATATALFGGLLALLGLALYHRIRPHAALENETRKAIFDAVCDVPGLGVHAIAKRAGVSYSTATYHLERLVAAGMLVMTPDGNKLCYYKNGGAFTESERKILPLLKNDEASRLLDAILETPGTYRAALAERLGVTATTINWHLKRLREAGLVRETREGRNAYLFVNEDVMQANVGSLAHKIQDADEAILDRLRRYAAHPSASS